jgi:hypothetical protein
VAALYKFLATGRVGRLSGFAWRPGEWVEVEPPVVPTRHGVHACRVTDLPHWLDDELWETELDGEIVESGTYVVASRGRLAGRVAGWDEAAAAELTEICNARARELGPAHPTAGWVPHAGAAYVAAHAAGLAAERESRTYAEGFATERRRQAAWLADRLGLADAET